VRDTRRILVQHRDGRDDLPQQAQRRVDVEGHLCPIRERENV